MNNQPYALLSSWGRPNMQNREWLAQTEDDKEDILTNESVAAGDKVYVIESKARYVLGLDLAWHNAKAGGGGPLEDIEVEYTTNDTYTIEPSTGYYGIGSAEITVNVEPALEDVTASYSANNTYTLTPSSGYDGIGSAEITINVEPALETLEEVYMENGQYTIRPTAGIDGISEVAVTVNVSGGGGESGEPTVFLYDYDGTVIASYTPVQFAALSAYPAAPVHSGLTFQEYNWPLATAKAYVANYGRCDIGATYITSDGKTRIYFYLYQEDELTVTLWLGVNGEAIIEWGDGSSSSITGEWEGTYSTEHTYAKIGHYIISITPPNGDDITLALCGGHTSEDSPFFVNGYAKIEKLELGDRTELGWATLDGIDAYSVVLPNTITGIPYGAFYASGQLHHITIPNGVTYIENCAFQGQSELRSISLPPSLTDMQSFLGGNTSLRSVCIPPSISEINPYTFEGCTALSNVVIPNGITSIQNYAFGDSNEGSTALTSITIPDSVTSIGEYAFGNCGLANIVMGSGLSSMEDYAFANCPLSFITLSNEITTLPNFHGSRLSSIIIPSHINYIPSMALAGTSLQTITIPETVQSIDEKVFSGCDSLFSAYIGSSDVGSRLFENCHNLRAVVFSENVSHIAGNTFDGSGSNLESLTFEGVEPPTLDNNMYVPNGCVIRVPQGSLSAYTSAENYPDPNTYTYVEY